MEVIRKMEGIHAVDLRKEGNNDGMASAGGQILWDGESRGNI